MIGYYFIIIDVSVNGSQHLLSHFFLGYLYRKPLAVQWECHMVSLKDLLLDVLIILFYINDPNKTIL